MVKLIVYIAGLIVTYLAAEKSYRLSQQTHAFNHGVMMFVYQYLYWIIDLDNTIVDDSFNLTTSEFVFLSALKGGLVWGVVYLVIETIKKWVENHSSEPKVPYLVELIVAISAMILIFV